MSYKIKNMEKESVVVSAKKIPKTLSEQIQELKVGEAIVIPTKRRVGAMSIITYWKRHDMFSGRTFKSRKKDKKNCYLIRMT